jgi:hypothetical protein
MPSMDAALARPTQNSTIGRLRPIPVPPCEVPFEEGAELARHWPGAELRPAAGLGHLRILRDARCVREAVGFLA